MVFLKKHKFLIFVLLLIIGVLDFIPIREFYYLKNGYFLTFERANNKSNVEYLKKAPPQWVALNQISKNGVWSIILSEDGRFYQHSGIDFEELKIATAEYLEGKRKRGASTITQQLVKNLFLTPKKTFWRKGREMVLSLMLEKILTKKRILEVYLNIVHLGKGLYGIKQASNYYFNKHPLFLNPKEGAFLAMLLPDPVSYSVSFRKKNLTPFARNSLNNILFKLRGSGIISDEEYDDQLFSPLVFEGQISKF